MKTTIKRLCVAVVALSVLGACGEWDVPDLNNPSQQSLEENPTPSVVKAAATGMLIAARGNYAANNGYITMLGIEGREAYILDPADPRFITEMLESPQLNPGSPAFGGNLWNLPYRNIRNGNTLLHALEKVAGFSAAELEAMRGYAKTIQALEFTMLISTRASQGLPVDVDRSLDEDLAPIVSESEAYAHISDLLDEAKAHLQAGGASFPFPLSSGFAAFDTPATFLEFNRGLKARIELYRGNHAGALTALSESFIDPTGNLTLGAYHAFSANSGDATNGLVSPTIYVHPSIPNEAEAGDARLTSKVMTVAEGAAQGLKSTWAFRKYRSDGGNVQPAPILRNEELLLIRAEAYLGTSAITEAAADVNTIRTLSGGLTARGDLNASNLLDEILKQRKYSLLFEGGHRWIDARRTGRLASLPKDLPDTHYHHAFFPIPQAELDARK